MTEGKLIFRRNGLFVHRYREVKIHTQSYRPRIRLSFDRVFKLIQILTREFYRRELTMTIDGICRRRRIRFPRDVECECERVFDRVDVYKPTLRSKTPRINKSWRAENKV